MRRVFLIYNPRSSRFTEVKRNVLDEIHNLKGYIVGKYEVRSTNLDDNITNFSKLLKDGDLVISAGGDATGAIAANSILKSGKDVRLAVLPYGNFNDLARTLNTKTLNDVLATGNNLSRGFRSAAARELAREPRGDGRERRDPRKVISVAKLYPLEIWVDGKFFRYSTCYVTIGMTAEAVHIYDQPAMRKKLKTNFGRKISSYTSLAAWYFKHRHKKLFIPNFSLNGRPQSPKISDYAAVNGHFMARIMRGQEDYLKPKTFRSQVDHLTNFYRLTKLMIKSIFHRIPGHDTTGDVLEFAEPSTVTLQAEGEHQIFHHIQKIEIKKGTKCLKVIKH